MIIDDLGFGSINEQTENWFWILDAKGEPKNANLREWLRWMHDANLRRKYVVAQETIGRSWVSTVLLTVHCDFPDNKPTWETMAFGGKLDHGQWRAHGSREQAEAQHAEIVSLARRAEWLWLWKPAVTAFFAEQFYDWRYTKLCLTNLLN